MNKNMQGHEAFKKVQGDLIVKLLITGENNENRADMYDKRYAKMRCSNAFVLDIYHMNTKVKYSSAKSLRNNMIYEVGKMVWPNHYDNNINNVCSEGIHYFLEEEPAHYWNNGSCDVIIDGIYKSWCENGQIEKILHMKGDSLDGMSESWYPNGQLRSRCYYKNDELNGSYESWHDNGQKWVKCNYKDNNYDGIYESWDIDGQPKENMLLQKK